MNSKMERQLIGKNKKPKKEPEKKDETQFVTDERTKPSILSDTGFRPVVLQTSDHSFFKSQENSKRSSLTSETPNTIVVKVGKEDEDKRIRQLGSFNAEHAFVSMIQVLEKHHDKGPVLDKRPNFKAPPDDSLNTFKLEDLERNIETLEKKVKFVSRRLAESKREKAETVRRIEYLENKLIQKAKEEVVSTFMKEQPTEKDLENLQKLLEKIDLRSKSHKELKQLQKQREMLNKTLKNAENIITDSSVIKRPRHVIIVEPGIDREKSRTSTKDTRIAQLQLDEKEQAKALLGSKENLLATTSVDELSTLQTTSGDSIDHDLSDIKQKKRILQQMLKQQDIGLENESPDRDPWTGEKLRPPGVKGEHPLHESSSKESINSVGHQSDREYYPTNGTHNLSLESQNAQNEQQLETVGKHDDKTSAKPDVEQTAKTPKEEKQEIPQSPIHSKTQPEKTQIFEEKTEEPPIVQENVEPIDKKIPTAPPDENIETKQPEIKSMKDEEIQPTKLENVDAKPSQDISMKEEKEPNEEAKVTTENLDDKPSEIKSMKEQSKEIQPTIAAEIIDSKSSEVKPTKEEEKESFEVTKPTTENIDDKPSEIKPMKDIKEPSEDAQPTIVRENIDSKSSEVKPTKEEEKPIKEVQPTIVAENIDSKSSEVKPTKEEEKEPIKEVQPTIVGENIDSKSSEVKPTKEEEKEPIKEVQPTVVGENIDSKSSEVKPTREEEKEPIKQVQPTIVAENVESKSTEVKPTKAEEKEPINEVQTTIAAETIDSKSSEVKPTKEEEKESFEETKPTENLEGKPSEVKSKKGKKEQSEEVQSTIAENTDSKSSEVKPTKEEEKESFEEAKPSSPVKAEKEDVSQKIETGQKTLEDSNNAEGNIKDSESPGQKQKPKSSDPLKKDVTDQNEKSQEQIDQPNQNKSVQKDEDNNEPKTINDENVGLKIKKSKEN